MNLSDNRIYTYALFGHLFKPFLSYYRSFLINYFQVHYESKTLSEGKSESGTPASGTNPSSTPLTSANPGGGNRRGTKKASLFAWMTLQSIPEETVISPHILDFLEQTLEPIPTQQKSPSFQSGK